MDINENKKKSLKKKKKNTKKKKQENHRGIPGANLTYMYLAPQDDFNGCKIIHWDPRNAFVHKDKFVCTMKKCMVSIATINTIIIYPLLFILDH